MTIGAIRYSGGSSTPTKSVTSRAAGRRRRMIWSLRSLQRCHRVFIRPLYVGSITRLELLLWKCTTRDSRVSGSCYYLKRSPDYALLKREGLPIRSYHINLEALGAKAVANDC